MIFDISVECVADLSFARLPKFHFHHLRGQPVSASWLAVVFKDENTGIQNCINHEIEPNAIAGSAQTRRVGCEFRSLRMH